MDCQGQKVCRSCGSSSQGEGSREMEGTQPAVALKVVLCRDPFGRTQLAKGIQSLFSSSLFILPYLIPLEPKVNPFLYCNNTVIYACTNSSGIPSMQDQFKAFFSEEKDCIIVYIEILRENLNSVSCIKACIDYLYVDHAVNAAEYCKILHLKPQ